MTSPLISIIIPVYNVSPYIRECLDSVLVQTISNWEAICVDDGSTDASGAILDEYSARDSRFRVIHQTNSGVSVARNIALDMVQGEWLVFLDSDDVWAENLLEKLMDAATINNASLAICGVLRFGGVNGDFYIGPMTDGMFSPEDLYVNYNSLCAWSCGKIYKRSLWNKIRFPVGVAYSEDRYVLHEIIYPYAKVPFVAGALYRYRSRLDSACGSEWNPKKLQRRFALEKQMSYFNENGFIKAELFTAGLYFVWISYDICNLMKTNPLNKELLEKTRADYYNIEIKYWKKFSKIAKREHWRYFQSCGDVKSSIDSVHSLNGHVKYTRTIWNIIKYDGILFMFRKILSKIKRKVNIFN